MFVLIFEKAFTHRMQATCSPRHKFHNKNWKMSKTNTFSRRADSSKMLKKQYEINIFALGASKKHWRIKYKPHARQDIKFTKKIEKYLQIPPFRQVPRAQKCLKNNTESRFSSCITKNMTKSATHAPRANHDKRITKTLNNVRKKNTFSQIAHSPKVL